MDHNCVGFYNHRYFVLFLIYMWAGCAYVAFMSSAPFFETETLGAPWPYPIGRGSVVFVFVLTLSIFLALTFMMVWQLYLVITAQTTIEFYFNRFRKKEAATHGRGLGQRVRPGDVAEPRSLLWVPRPVVEDPLPCPRPSPRRRDPVPHPGRLVRIVPLRLIAVAERRHGRRDCRKVSGREVPESGYDLLDRRVVPLHKVDVKRVCEERHEELAIDTVDDPPVSGQEVGKVLQLVRPLDARRKEPAKGSHDRRKHGQEQAVELDGEERRRKVVGLSNGKRVLAREKGPRAH